MRPDWVSKTLAGTVLGLVLGLVVSAIFSELSSATPLALRGQQAMWMVAPIWLGTAGFVYFFRSGLRAWLWLGGLDLLGCAVLLALRHT